MTTKNQGNFRIILIATAVSVSAALGFLLFVNLLFAALNLKDIQASGDKCIGCHSSVFNQGIESPEIHLPFWERQCVICHMAEGSSWVAENSNATQGTITGSVVTQENLWRKSLYSDATSFPSLEQAITFTKLDMNTAYRFRIGLSQEGDRVGNDLQSSQWFGLRPDELGGSSDSAPVQVQTQWLDPYPQILLLSRSGEGVGISWKTSQLFYGWVEIQDLYGPGYAEPAAVTGIQSAQHPLMRSPEDLAINACYQCHPESTLGTSHPVRLYGGKNVRIANELPTVDGMLTCVTCHNPHGAAGKMLVRETIKTKLCVACHFTFKNSSRSTMFN